MYPQLFSFLASIKPLSPALAAALPSYLTEEKWPRRHMLLKEGQVCNRIYFIVEGTVRAYYNRDGQDFTSWFLMENDFIISVYSFFTRRPSYENIELLTDSVLLSIRYENLQRLYNDFPEFNYTGRILTEYYYAKTEEQALALRMQTAQERYENLLQKSPQLFQRVSLKDIATYLGMSPETLSRIRRKIR